jgi:tellurite resistance protein TerC
MSEDLLLVVGFNLFVLLMLALDLGVFHRKSHTIRVREALAWSAVWVTLALAFNVGLYFWRGPEPALQFLTGYLIEESLSVDNLFVFLLVFTYFGVSTQYQHKVLFWGILGAALMRATLIVLGSALIQQFHWVIYVFGGFLVLTGLRMAFSEEGEVHPEKNVVVKLFKRVMPVTVVLIVLETTDLVFAVDSIPAIFAVSTDPVIVYTSNIFAILGLRSMYFALAGMMELFHHLKVGLSVVLVFIGVKMLLSPLYDIPIHFALIVVAGILGLSIIASLLWPGKGEPDGDTEGEKTAGTGSDRDAGRDSSNHDG